MTTARPEAPCPRCRNEMAFVTAMPHKTAAQMFRTIFLCKACNQTNTYTLSAAMADAYANTAATG